jgi:acetyl esterase/lipase
MVSGLALVMDVHRPAAPNGYGIVWISGSGYARPLAYNAPLLSESLVGMYEQPLVNRGYTVFSLNHRATPRFRYPDPLEDVQRAVRFIRAHASDYGIDPNRLGAVGGSSGGHLVLLLGTLDGDGDGSDPDPVNQVSAKVQTVVAFAAPADLAKIQTAIGREVLPLLMGAPSTRNAHTEEARRYRAASPVTFASADDAPTLLVHGDADEAVPFEQADFMHAALAAVKVPSTVLVVPGGRHGPTFPGALNPPDYIAAMVQWFDRHLRK